MPQARDFLAGAKAVPGPPGDFLADAKTQPHARLLGGAHAAMGPAPKPSLVRRLGQNLEHFYTHPVPGTFTKSPEQIAGSLGKAAMVASAPLLAPEAAAAPLAAGLGLAGAAAGGYLGEKLGKYGGGKVGAPSLGRDIGGLAGGILGGGLGALKGPEAIETGRTALRRGIVNHPAATITGGEVLGAGAGMLGGKMAGAEGEGLGTLGGVYAGRAVAQRFISAQEESMISDVMNGKMDWHELPERLLPKYMTEVKARAAAMVDMAAQRGQTLDMAKIPVGLREAVEDETEERLKMVPREPRAVLTEEEMRDLARKGQLAQILKEEAHPQASLRGMLHAAGEHDPEFSPFRRTVTTGTAKSYRLTPKLRP